MLLSRLHRGHVAAFGGGKGTDNSGHINGNADFLSMVGKSTSSCPTTASARLQYPARHHHGPPRRRHSKIVVATG